MKRFIAFLFALVIAAPAAAEPVTPATFDAAFAAALGGETFELAPGDYGILTLRNQMFPSDVTIISADPANPAIARELDVNDSSHIILDGILFDYVTKPSSKPWDKPFAVRNSSFVTIRNSVFDGAEVPSTTGDPGTYGNGFGLWVLDVNNVVIENNEFFEFVKALAVYNSTNIIVNANDVHSIQSDAFNFIAVDGLLVEGNWLHDFKTDPTAGNHPDMIQLWVVAGEMASRNVVIRGNFLDAGAGGYTQTIFMGTGPGEDAWQNILIENNVIYNAHIHGITVGETDGLTIRNNTLLYDSAVDDGSTGGNGPPRLNLDVSSLNVTIEDNITATGGDWDATVNHPGWTVGNNLLVQSNDPNGENYYSDLFVNALAVPASLADLRALPGGVIELGAIGAPMTRADIPMLAGPYATAPDPDPDPDPAPEPDPDPDWQAALAALQAQVDANTAITATLAAELAAIQTQIDSLLGGLTMLEGAHDALVADVDARLGVVLLAISAIQTQIVVLDARITIAEARIAAGATGLGG